MSNIYLIRHAESAANAGLVTTSPEGVPLTEKGQLQAQALAKSLQVQPQTIVHSPFVRAKQTAAPLIAEHKNAKVYELPVQEFTYLNPSAWNGTTAAQRWPAVEAFWNKADPHHCDGEGTESFIDMMRRADALIHWSKQQAAALTAPICVVSHGIFICAVLWRLKFDNAEEAASQMAAFRQFQLAQAPLNTAVTRLKYSQEQFLITPTLLLWSDTALLP